MAKERIFPLISLLLICVILMCTVVPVSADEDPAQQLAQACFEAIQDGSGTAEVQIRTDDVEAVLDDMVAYYPVLCHYYNGASCTEFVGTASVEVKLKNTDDSPDSIPVVTDRSDLLAVIGLGFLDLREEISFVTKGSFDLGRELPDAVKALSQDYYLAYMGYDGYESQYTDFDGIAADVSLKVNYKKGVSRSELQQWRNDTETAWLDLANSLIAADMPEPAAVLYIHDWIVEHTKYNINNMDEPSNHTAYGCLVLGSCVCQGYAEAFDLLCQAVGIECHYVSGTGVTDDGEEGHAWNAVRVDGEWYMVDTTWDDPVTSNGEDVLRYDYFMVTSDQLSADHRWDAGAYPSCDGSTWNADAVLQHYAQSEQQYTQYGTSGVMTQNRIRQELTAVLSGGQNTPVTGTEEKPAQTATVPAQTVPIPVPGPVDQETEKSGSWIWWVLIPVALLLVGGGAAAAFLYRGMGRKQGRKYMETTSWGSSIPKVQTQGRRGKKGGSGNLPGNEW